MFVAAPLPSLRPAAASANASASASRPRPPILQPMPRSGGRAKWLADKKFKFDRSPDLDGGNGFGPSLLDHHYARPVYSSLPTPTTSRPASPKALSLAALAASLVPTKRKLARAPPQLVLALVVAGLLWALRTAVHDFAPQTLLSDGHRHHQGPMTTADLLLPVEFTAPFTTAAVAGAADDGAGLWARFFEGPGAAAERVQQAAAGPKKHRATANGLLEVDPDLPATQHPIYQLIEEAKDEWAAKLARQSTSLAEAVAEYKRRNGGLAPPKGFDHWWAYVQEHEVQLPDEYDRINVDLAPFRGLAPAVLRRRIAELQAPGQGHESFTLAVHGGQASTSHVTYDGASIGGADDRKAGQLALVADVARWLPDFEAVYSIHDAPTRFVSYGHRQDLEFAAEDGEYLDPAVEVDVDGHSWAAACPYGSPLRKDGPQPVPAGKSFIKSHTASMDLCSHPSVPALHGLTLGLTPAPQAELLPLFSLSKTGLHADILGIPVEQWLESASDDGATAWSEKTDDRLLWRGRNTGGVFSADVDWRSSHRARLTATSGDDVKGSFPVLPSPGEADGSRTLANATLDRSLASLNRAMLDVGLAYDPIQCVEEDGSCQAIADELTFRPVKTFEEEVAFRYILDVDGNAWSARFKRLLSTGSLVLKSTIFPEWWNDRVQPWYHYVPVKVDYSDVYDTMAFFRGTDASGTLGEDALAAQIAGQGLEWSHSFWRKEDMTAYLFRLYLEYGRLVAVDRRNVDFELPDDQQPPTAVDVDDGRASPDANVF